MLTIILIGYSASLAYSIFSESLKTQSCSEFFPLLFGNKDEDAHDHIDRGPIPGMTPAQALTTIQTMADHSKKWHDGTTSRKIRSSRSNDGLAALFIDEGRREHEEMGAFIREFKTTNELLLKERNNSLSELKFEVYGLSKAINDAQLSNYEVKGLGEPKPTRMSLELANRSIQYPRGIAENVLIKIDKFILPIDFVILNMREDSKILIILGRPFLEIARAMIDVFNKKITLRVGNEEVIFDVDQSIKRPPAEDDECYGIDFLDTTIHSKTQELLEDDQLDLFLVGNLEESIDLSDLESCGKADDSAGSRIPIWRIEEINTSYSQETNRTDKTQSEHFISPAPTKSTKKRPILKDLTSHLEYTYLKGD
ncbi:reverse transcriptase domain-containing protein [Tanacetum coccineum]